MIRKALFIAAAVLISCSNLIVGTISAADNSPDASPKYSYIDTYNSKITFSGSTATCQSKAKGYINTTTKIVFDQTLQKQNYLGGWSSVSGAHWVDTVYYYKGSATHDKDSLSSGTYRLRNEMDVYSGSDYETIVDYSTEETL